MEVWDESFLLLAWIEQSLPPSACAHVSSAQLVTFGDSLTLIQLDTKCSCDLPRSLTVAVTSSLALVPWRVNWKTVHDKCE